MLYLMSYGHHREVLKVQGDHSSPCGKKLVGVERFELPTSCSQSRRATRLRYTPIDLLLLGCNSLFFRRAHDTHQPGERQRHYDVLTAF